jgi:hypothetical protein
MVSSYFAGWIRLKEARSESVRLTESSILILIIDTALSGFRKVSSTFLRLDLFMNGLVAAPGRHRPDGTHEPARQKVCGACVGGNLTGSLEGVREVVWPLSIRLV